MNYNLLIVVDRNQSGVRFHRQDEPHKHLSKQFPEFNIKYHYSDTILTEEDFKDIQLVQFQRQLSITQDISSIAEMLNKKGIVILLDIDDYWYVDKTSHSYGLHQLQGIAKKVEESIKFADCVTTPCDVLLDEIDKAEYLPNAIDPESEQFKINDTPSELVRFGWIGGISHLKDIELLANSIKRFDNDIKIRNKWQIVLGGFDIQEKFYQSSISGEVTEVNVPKFRLTYPRIETILTNSYKCLFNYPNYVKLLKEYDQNVSEFVELPYRRLPSLTVDKYAIMYNEIDVSLVPLVQSKFNSCKSNLKIVEAGFKKKAIIASEVLPYTYDLNENNSILVNNKLNNWYVAMRRLVVEPNLRADLGEALYETVKDDFDIRNATKTRAQLYKDLISKKNK